MYFIYSGILILFKFLLWNSLWLPAYSKYNTVHNGNKEHPEVTKKFMSNRANGDFSYNGTNGPKNWPTLFPKCGGQNQSPIDIRNSELQYNFYKDLVWSLGYFQYPANMTIQNDGNGVKLYTYLNSNKPYIKNGPLQEKYLLEQIHFHWGNQDDIGSEHSVNGRFFPMEMHAVHYKESAGSIENALNVPNGLAVIGYFFHISFYDNLGLSAILDKTNKLKSTKNEPLPLDLKFPLVSLTRPFYRQYVTYNGSLTTPPCNEVVVWILSPYTLHISRQQLNQFRDIASANGYVNNFRNIQSTNNRNVVYVL